ncbi:phage holin family protein [Castellaniella sp.]|uniref:phage holin family protein n=1 Tax=Castellaniella sp. TaxID=1955812 RepID=UPI002AFF4138|nr:phage holin family protein [Castellaniella sp.]
MAFRRALQDLTSQTLALVVTRLELASLEALQVRDRLLCRLAVLLLSAIFILLALLVATLAFALWAWPTEQRYVALACMAGLYAVLGLGLIGWLVRQSRRDAPPFSVTLDVLRQDAQVLHPEAGAAEHDAALRAAAAPPVAETEAP